ncbi:enoyl-CoA hydratase domain-containing protein 2, mitochondrial [Gadus chalcogrammus]|uniref:enoyl-CoA hydratase domain-containing protein 2, mitochondrial n=1 Tax=Gadus chalcogrammus TaxID=1042646 RepID=UPI0024C4B1B1|nr:enoyl-CoA hydratase domain-containing protein 2, mitochondrial [Gadus chalcogrammus]
MTFLCSIAARRVKIIRPESNGGTFGFMWRGGVQGLVSGDVRLPVCYNRTHSRGQHTEATPSAEVDVKRLDGEDTGIVEVVMRRHKARNALGHVFISQMREIITSLSCDTASRVVIFRSMVPGVFCAGADLKERAAMNNISADSFVHRLRTLMTDIASMPMPTIAAMDGAALGGGLELALACDLRTAAYSAQMGLIETTRGLLPGAGGSQRLPRLVGISLAKELIFTGRRVGGRAALGLGLVNQATEQNQTGDAAYTEALSLAREILPQAPVAIRLAKEAMDRGIEVEMTKAMAIERLCYSMVIPTRDRQEGMAAFLEKRKPNYTGE